MTIDMAVSEVRADSETEATNVNALVKRLVRGARGRKRLHWAAFVGFEVYILFSWLGIRWLSSHLDSAHLMTAAYAWGLWGVFLPSLVFGLLIGRINMRLSRNERDAARQLAECTDPRCIGPLLDASGMADKQTQKAIVATFAAALGKVRSDDAVHLTDRNLRAMYILLRCADGHLHRAWAGERADDLVVATLHAIGQIGDSRALEHVQRLAYGESDVGDAIRAAAQECLPLLKARIAVQEARSNLLVPAATPEADSLLVPASSMPESDRERLLRPESVCESASQLTN